MQCQCDFHKPRQPSAGSGRFRQSRFSTCLNVVEYWRSMGRSPSISRIRFRSWGGFPLINTGAQAARAQILCSARPFRWASLANIVTNGNTIALNITGEPAAVGWRSGRQHWSDRNWVGASAIACRRFMVKATRWSLTTVRAQDNDKSIPGHDGEPQQSFDQQQQHGTQTERARSAAARRLDQAKAAQLRPLPTPVATGFY